MNTTRKKTRSVASADKAGYLLASGLVPVYSIPGSTVRLVFDDERRRATDLLDAWEAAEGHVPIDAANYANALHQVRDIVPHNRTNHSAEEEEETQANNL